MKQHLILQHSEPHHPSGSRLLSNAPDPAEIIHVTVVLRIDPEEPESRAASQKDLELVHNFARAHNLKVLESSARKRYVRLSGASSLLSAAFHTTLTLHEHRGIRYRSHSGPLQIPVELEHVVSAVLGLDNRALMEPHAYLHAHLSAGTHCTSEEVARAYDFPDCACKAQRIAIIELGGGFHKPDITQYFDALKLPEPEITVMEIEGQLNNPASRDLIEQMLDAMGRAPEDEHPAATAMDRSDAIRAMWTIETTLDLQLAGSFAPGAKIVIYFAPNNAQGKYHALTSALHSEQHPPSVISCSWGATEEDLPLDVVQSLDSVFQDAAHMGITVCYSSGDRGEDAGKNGEPRVHFPASSPHVLSCGGSHWLTTGSREKEVVWSEKLPTTLAQSGGGTSCAFDEPPWQKSADVKSKTGRSGRGVPDVAGKADMSGGYEMIVGGFRVTMGGTSAAAPMWSGLVARMNEELGKHIGYLTPLLYEDAFRDAFNDITEGNTGKRFKAAPGWDPCTGWGTPNGKKLLAALKARM